MSDTLWILALFLVLLGSAVAIIPLSRSYAALKINVYFAIDELKEDLQIYRNNLRVVSIEFSENFSVKDSEPYGSNAQFFQQKLKFVHDQIFYSIEKRGQICKR